MYKTSSQRIAVQRVLRANMLRYMQGIFSQISNPNVIKSIQKYILDSDFLWDILESCVDIDWEFKSKSISEFMGWGEVIVSNDWYTPDEAEEVYLNAPDSYQVKLFGSINSICLAKVLAKKTAAAPYLAILEQVVERSDFAKLIVDALIGVARNYSADVLEGLEGLAVDLQDDWLSEAGERLDDFNFNAGIVKVKGGKVKSSGAKINFELDFIVEVEVEDISVAAYEPDPDDYARWDD